MNHAALESPSLILRIVLGKMVGFFIGLAGISTLPIFAADFSWMLMIGIVLWYSSLGAIIGVFGVFDNQPVFEIAIPWWLRAPLLGGWFNFVLTLLAYDQLSSLLNSITWFRAQMFSSPFWFVLEGAIVGFIIGAVCNWLGGEGAKTVRSL
ncbi:MAG: hypothetical protein ACR2PF_17330 [Rhizobiaceae bacterium]